MLIANEVKKDGAPLGAPCPFDKCEDMSLLTERKTVYGMGYKHSAPPEHMKTKF